MAKYAKGLGKNLNIETHYNSHTGKITTIERDSKRLRRGWGKHRMEEECHSTYCGRLGKIVEYQHGKPKSKYNRRKERRAYYDEDFSGEY